VSKVFRADQVGSLLRPPELLEARAAHVEDLHAIEDRAIAEALEKQRAIGLDVVTDGEMRRASWLADMAAAVEGFGPARLILDWKGPGGGAEATHASAVIAKLRKVRKLTGHEVPFLKKSAAMPFKMTVPAPSNFMVASYTAGVTDKIYATHADLLRELAATHDAIVTIEEGAIMGGAGSACVEALLASSIVKPVLQLGLPDIFIDHGDPAKLLASVGLDSAGIVKSIRERFIDAVESAHAEKLTKRVA